MNDNRRSKKGRILITLAAAAMPLASGCVLEKDPNAIGGGKGAPPVKVEGDEALSAVHRALGKSCYQCHSDLRKLGLDGSVTRRYVVAGEPLRSKLFVSLKGVEGDRSVTDWAGTMPTLGDAPSKDDIEAVRAWIAKLQPSAAPAPSPVAKLPLPAPRLAQLSPPSPSGATLFPVIVGTFDAGQGTEPASAVERVYLFRDAACSQSIGVGLPGQFSGAGLAASVAANAETVIHAQSQSGDGRKSECVRLVGFTHDDVAPAAPSLGSTVPAAATAASASQNTAPMLKGASAPQDAARIQVYLTPNCSGAVAVSGTREVFLAAGFQLAMPPVGTTQISAKAVDAAGNASACSANPLAYVTASAAPANPVASALEPAAVPAAPSSNRRPTLKGTAPNNGSTVTTSVKLFRDPACSAAQEVGSTTAINATTKAFAIALSADIASGSVDQDVELYGKAYAGTSSSACVKLTGTAAAPAYRLDTLAPAAPSFGAISPLAPFATSSPKVTGSVASADAVQVELFANADCSGAANSSGTVSAFASAGQGIALDLSGIAANAQVTLSARARDKAGNVSPCAPSLVSFQFNPDAATRLAKATAVIRGASCVSCHGASAGSLSLVRSTDAEWQAARSLGGNAMVVAGKPEESVLFQRLKDNGLAAAAMANMPTNGALSAADIQVLRHWIASMGVVAIPPPASPAGALGFAPASPSSAASPKAKLAAAGVAADAGFVEFFGNSSCSGPVLGSGARDAVVGEGIALAAAANAKTDVYARAYNDASKARASACSALLGSYVHDGVAPAAPVVASSVPASSDSAPSLELSPKFKGTAPGDAAAIQLFTTAGCSGTPAATGTAAEFTTGAGIALGVASSATTRVSARSVDAAGNVSACSAAALAFVNGSSAPSAPVLASIAPAATAASPSNERRPTLKGTAPNNGSTATTSVKLFRDSACTAAQEIGSTTAVDAATRAFTITLSADIATGAVDKDLDVYGKAFSSAASNNASACVKLTGGTGTPAAYRLDTTAPAAPVLGAISPAAPFSTTTPRLSGASASSDAVQVQVFTTANCSGAANATGAVADFVSAAKGVALNLAATAANANVVLSANVVDKAGNASSCSAATLGFQFNPDAAARLAKANEILRGTSCASCHGAGAGSLSLVKASDVEWQLAKNVLNEPMIVPGKPEMSGLFLRLKGNGVADAQQANMPSGGSLSAAEINALRYWIANMPVAELPAVAAPKGALSFSPVSPSSVSTTPKAMLAMANLVAEAGFVDLFSTANCSGAPIGSGDRAAITGAGIGLTVPANAKTDVYGKAYADSARKRASACSAALGSYTHDATPPAAPVVASSVPASSSAQPASELNPRFKGTAASDAATLRLFTNSDCSGTAAATGTAADFVTGAGIALAVQPGTTTSVRARALDALGNASACSAALAYVSAAGAPDKPLLASIVPVATAAAPSKDTQPTLAGTVTSTNGSPLPTSVKLYLNADCAANAAPKLVGTATVDAAKAWTVKVSALATGAVEQVIPLHGQSVTASGGLSACVKLTGTASAPDYVLDTRAPAIAVTMPAQSSMVINTNLAVTGSCQAGLAVAITGDRVSPSTYPCPSSGAMSLNVQLTAGNGAKTLTFAQTDAAGNTGSLARMVSLMVPAPTPTPTPQPLPNSATYNYLSATIFQPKCTGCHSGGTGSPAPNFSSYAKLIAGASVKPFNGAQSALYLRMADRTMPPPPIAPVSDAEVANVKAWIDAGAPDGGTPPIAAGPSPTPTPTRAPAGSQNGTVSVRNFMQLRESMAVVTGVDLGVNLNGKADPQPAITSFYEVFKTQLPLVGSASEISPSMLLATTSMAGLFCQAALAREKPIPMADPRRLLFNDINFTKTQAFLTPAVRTAQIQRFARAFWRRDATDAEIADLQTAIDEALAGRPSSTDELQNALQVTCTSALSSTEFIKN